MVKSITTMLVHLQIYEDIWSFLASHYATYCDLGSVLGAGSIIPVVFEPTDLSILYYKTALKLALNSSHIFL